MHSPDASPDPSDTLTVAGRILAAQRLRGLTDTALARASGLTRAALWHLTRGTTDGAARTAVATIAALAPALQCDAAWLAFGEPYPAPRSAPPTLPGTAAEAEAPEHGSPLPVAQLRAALDAARAELPAPVASAPFATEADDATARTIEAVRAALAGGLSQHALARASGVGQAIISRLASRGTVPRPANLARLAAWVRANPLPAAASASVEAA